MYPWSHLSALLVVITGLIVPLAAVAKHQLPWYAYGVIGACGLLMGLVFAEVSVRISSRIITIDPKTRLFSLVVLAYLSFPFVMIAITMVATAFCAKGLARVFA